MPSSEKERKAARAALSGEMFFNILGGPGDYERGSSSVRKHLAALDAVKKPVPKTESQFYLSLIDRKLSMIIGLMAESNAQKIYTYQGLLQDISEFGLGFGHSKELEVGTYLELGVKLPGEDTSLMDIAGHVVNRQQPPEGARYDHVYGVEFTDITAKDQNEIVQWIFTSQREQIRKRSIVRNA